MLRILAVTGFAGAGKSTAIDYLVSIGFGSRVYVGQLVIDELAARKLEVSPENEMYASGEGHGDGGLRPGLI